MPGTTQINKVISNTESYMSFIYQTYAKIYDILI